MPTFLGFCTVALVVGYSSPDARAAAPDPVLRIGMISSMFRDVPEAYVNIASHRFGTIVKSYTGMNSQVELSDDAESLARQLRGGAIHVGVFHGFEFAQVQRKYDDLTPLMIAVPASKVFRACLIVKADCDATGLADLQGGRIAMPLGNREHCRVYLDRERTLPDGSIVSYELTEPATSADALDMVVDGLATATVVDRSVLEGYSALKPGRGRQLKVLTASEEFPLSVIVYRTGALQPTTLQRFRDGLTQVHTSQEGRFMLRLWKLSKFSNLPANYSAQLAAILKSYPKLAVIE